MTAIADTETSQDLRDEILRVLWRKRRACAADIANELAEPTTADQVLPVMVALEDAHLVKRTTSKGDPRKYVAPYQTVYELVR